jgi:hypothetical protein
MKKLLIVAILSMMANAQAFTVNEMKRWPISYQNEYMIGIMDGMAAMGFTCGGQTYGQDYEVIKKYIANNPAEWGLEAPSIYVSAITQAYHCEDIQSKPTAIYRYKPNKPKTEVRW